MLPVGSRPGSVPPRILSTLTGSAAMEMVFIPLSVIGLLALLTSLRVLMEYERGVIFRLGKLIRAKGPGLIFLLPFGIERMRKMDLRMIALDVAPQDTITKDNVTLKVIERTGELETEGCGLIWREEHGFGRTEVRAVPDGPVVEVSATAERGGHLLALVLVLATAVALALQPLGGFGGLAALGGPLLAVVGPVAAVMAGTRLLWPALQRPTLRRLEAAALEVGAMVEESGRAATE